MSFKEERSKSEERYVRYGKDIVDNFSVKDDLTFWKLKAETTKNGYLIQMVHPEVSALCPVSNFADSGKISIEYVPNEFTVELKSLKLYINSFRNMGISHEDLANTVFNELKEGLQPKYLQVKLEMAPRGNVTTIITVDTRDRDYG